MADYGVPVSTKQKRDVNTDTARRDYDGEFEDFYVCQQKEVVIRPVWQPQADNGPFEAETSNGRTYEQDNPAASHASHKGHSGRNK